ncbi:Type I restriction modification DNA specificity domain protein [Corynebacterium felinum]|nr:Type I restriction modification DNA specificity domain protein [Corynebacterium felinum]
MASFGDLVDIVKDTVKPSELGPDEKYLAYEHIEPSALRVSRFESVDGITSQKSRFSKDQIIYGRLRPYFRKVIFTGENEGICSSDFWVFRAKSGVHPRFAFYVAALKEFSDMAASSSTGTRMPRASWDVVKNFEVPDFSFKEQQEIGRKLGLLDDKIESNQRMLRANYDLVGLYFRELTSRVPVKRIPLSNLVEITKGVSYKSSELQDSDCALVTIKSFDRNGGYKSDGLKAYTGHYKEGQLVGRGELIVAQTDLTQNAEVVGRVVRLPDITDYNHIVASLDLLVIRPSDPQISNSYLYGILSSNEFRQWCRNRVNGTTVLHLAKDAVPTFEAPVIPRAYRREFEAVVSKIFQKSDSLRRENELLTELRDTLLPELLSRRITSEQLEAGL